MAGILDIHPSIQKTHPSIQKTHPSIHKGLKWVNDDRNFIFDTYFNGEMKATYTVSSSYSSLFDSGSETEQSNHGKK